MKQCPSCKSEETTKNGTTHNGKAKRKCKACGRQYTLEPSREPISQEKWEMVKKMRLEGMSLRGVHRVTGIALSWLVEMNKRWAKEVEQTIENEEPVEKKRKFNPAMR